MFCLHLIRPLIWPPVPPARKDALSMYLYTKTWQGYGICPIRYHWIWNKPFQDVTYIHFTSWRKKEKNERKEVCRHLIFSSRNLLMCGRVHCDSTTQQDALRYNSCCIYSSCTLGRLLERHSKRSRVQVVHTGE